MPRPTAATVAIVDRLAEATSTHRPTWGLKICQETGFGPGTVYAVLDRLADLGWVTADWEQGEHSEARPRRRLYSLTPKGVSLRSALHERAERTARRRIIPSLAGGTA
jgi:DNA-binding PadR family transcriptional regulator